MLTAVTLSFFCDRLSTLKSANMGIWLSPDGELESSMDVFPLLQLVKNRAVTIIVIPVTNDTSPSSFFVFFIENFL
jgi:hypothetical protein